MESVRAERQEKIRRREIAREAKAARMREKAGVVGAFGAEGEDGIHLVTEEKDGIDDDEADESGDDGFVDSVLARNTLERQHRDTMLNHPELDALKSRKQNISGKDGTLSNANDGSRDGNDIGHEDEDPEWWEGEGLNRGYFYCQIIECRGLKSADGILGGKVCALEVIESDVQLQSIFNTGFSVQSLFKCLLRSSQ